MSVRSTYFSVHKVCIWPIAFIYATRDVLRINIIFPIGFRRLDLEMKNSVFCKVKNEWSVSEMNFEL
jgi:hypothetical protein